MFDLHCVDYRLNQMELYESDIMVAPVFFEEQPLCGLADLFDFRMAGFISNQLVEKVYQPERLRTLMIASEGKFACEKMLIVGAGIKGEFDQSFLEAWLIATRQNIEKLQAKKILLEMPGIRLDGFSGINGPDILFSILSKLSSLEQLVIVDKTTSHHNYEIAYENLRRKIRAEMKMQ